MGLFSKLLGDTKEAEQVEKAAKSFLGDLLNGQIPQQNQQRQPAQQTAYDDKSSNSSYGSSEYDEIPAEPNQYNFGGPYTAYFESIFSSEFPRYSFEKSSDGKRTVYNFMDGDNRVLVVELMTERSSANMLRKNCARMGVPYLRFYYDHDGWWNKRSYVVERLSTVLN